MRRASSVWAVVAVIAIGGCASRPKPPAVCPQLDPGKEADIIFPLLQKEFGYLREGYTAKVVSRRLDERGDTILQLDWILSSTATDSVGSKRLTLVIQKCTLKVLSVRRPNV